MKTRYYIIGAPKCGTTTLAYWLEQTPSVYMTQPKEPHYYSPDYKEPHRRVTIRLREEYDALFSRVESRHLAVGEASTNYLWSQFAIPSIMKDQPNAKFIVCLRNPVDMARSMHAHHQYWGIDPIRNFESAWRLNTIRGGGKRTPKWSPNPGKLDYFNACSVGTQLQKMLALVDSKNIKFVFIEDLKDRPKETYESIIHFLGATPEPINFSSKNVTKYRRSNFYNTAVCALKYTARGKIPWRLIKPFQVINDRFNTTSLCTIPRMTPDFRRYLINEFEVEICKIEEITGANLRHWRR